MATLLREFGDDYSTISFQYEEDEVESLPSWGDSFELGDDDEDKMLVTVGKKIFDKSGIAVYEVLAVRLLKTK